MTKSSRRPSTSETAFECPHCGAYTSQHWYRLAASPVDRERRTPMIPSADAKDEFERDEQLEPEVRALLLAWTEKMNSGQVFFERSETGRGNYREAHNLHISE